MDKLAFLLFSWFIGLSYSGSPPQYQDLFERMLTFPADTNTTHVTVHPQSTQTSIRATTVCLRFFTDSTRVSSLFSLATLKEANGLVLWRDELGVSHGHVNDQVLPFPASITELGQWNSLCNTWENATGLSQMWLNGKPSPRKLVSPGFSIDGVPSIVLGQEQDSYGGDFDALQSFVGSLTDVYMWDSVLSPKEIQYYMTGVIVRPGNVVDWRKITFTNTDAVVEETSLLSFGQH